MKAKDGFKQISKQSFQKVLPKNQAGKIIVHDEE